eukprot:476674-Amphidinium_carterae.1
MLMLQVQQARYNAKLAARCRGASRCPERSTFPSKGKVSSKDYNGIVLNLGASKAQAHFGRASSDSSEFHVHFLTSCYDSRKTACGPSHQAPTGALPYHAAVGQLPADARTLDLI